MNPLAFTECESELRRSIERPLDDGGITSEGLSRKNYAVSREIRQL